MRYEGLCFGNFRWHDLGSPRPGSQAPGSLQPPLHKMLTKSSAVSIAAPRRSLTAAHNITTSYFPRFNWLDADTFTEIE